jgi:hypothetical protein
MLSATNNKESEDPVDPAAAIKIQVFPIIIPCVPNQKGQK